MNKTPEMMEGTHKRYTLPKKLHFCFDHGVHYDPDWMCWKCETEICEPNDKFMKIIEAAYHCALHIDEVHEMIKNNGLPESSDETIAFLIGEYGDSL